MEDQKDIWEDNMIKCRHAKEYKAVHPPKCNGGRGCEECNQKWQSIGRAKARLRERYTKVSSKE